MRPETASTWQARASPAMPPARGADADQAHGRQPSGAAAGTETAQPRTVIAMPSRRAQRRAKAPAAAGEAKTQTQTASENEWLDERQDAERSPPARNADRTTEETDGATIAAPQCSKTMNPLPVLYHK